MIGRRTGEPHTLDSDVVDMTGDTRPDPERIRAGWVHRFVATGVRAEEMAELYRELGYEVAADPVVTHTLDGGCVVCLTSGGEQYLSIYTRRPAPDPTTHNTQEKPDES